MHMKLPEIVNTLAALEGVKAAAIVDYESGMIMASAVNDNDCDIEVLAASGSNIIGAKKRTIQLLENDDVIHDILISMTHEYHLLCPCSKKNNMFIYMVINRTIANLSTCRRALFRAETFVT